MNVPATPSVFAPNPRHGITVERFTDDPTAVRVTVTKNLDRDNAPQFRMLCDEAIDVGRRTITVDLTHCADIDKRGFEMLVAIANRATRSVRGGSVTIVGAHEDLRTLFGSHGIASLFRFEPSEVTP